MTYKLIFDDIWIKQIKKIDKSLLTKISKALDRLEKDPFNVGKKLRYTKGRLRELRVGPFRIYFTIVDKTVEISSPIILILKLGHKDEQKKIINKLNLELNNKIKKATDKIKLIFLIFLL